MTTPSADNLVAIKPGVLERGDCVWEVVKYGTRDTDVKFVEMRVISADRGAATVHAAFGSNPPHRKIRFERLRMEKRPEAAAPQSPPPALKSAADPDLDAWLEMGRGIVAGITREESEVAAEEAQIGQMLAEIDAAHRSQIEALEAELANARAAHTEERAHVEKRRGQLITKRKALAERKAAVSKRVGG